MQSHTEPWPYVADNRGGLHFHGVKPNHDLQFGSDAQRHRHIDETPAQAYIGDSGHWVQQEKPELVNQLMLEFLSAR